LLSPLLFGCLPQARSDPTRYWVLDRATDLRRELEWPTGATIGIERVELPEYLKRDELVSRVSHRLEVDEVNRWAEPLDSAFARILSEDLRSLIGNGHLVDAPWDSAHAPDVVVTLQLRRFERVGNRVELDADWQLREARGKQQSGHRTHLERPLRQTDPETTLSGINSLIADLGREIAARARHKDVLQPERVSARSDAQSRLFALRSSSARSDEAHEPQIEDEKHQPDEERGNENVAIGEH
jgi:uncharacterized lipoprotein YmbA